MQTSTYTTLSRVRKSLSLNFVARSIHENFKTFATSKLPAALGTHFTSLDSQERIVACRLQVVICITFPLIQQSAHAIVHIDYVNNNIRSVKYCIDLACYIFNYLLSMSILILNKVYIIEFLLWCI